MTKLVILAGKQLLENCFQKSRIPSDWGMQVEAEILQFAVISIQSFWSEHMKHTHTIRLQSMMSLPVTWSCRVLEMQGGLGCHLCKDRHTQNRRRYSLNALSQGGEPWSRKKQSHGSGDRGQVHHGEQRPAITRVSGSSSDTKLSWMKKIVFLKLLCRP